MKFYTNFYVNKSTLLIREYDNGIENIIKKKISPSYYFVTDKESEHKSIYGHNLIKLDYDTQYEARDWLKQYETMKDKIFGFPHYEYTMINEMYPDMKYDTNKLLVGVFDIETEAEGRAFSKKHQIKVRNKKTPEIETYLSIYEFEQCDVYEYEVYDEMLVETKESATISWFDSYDKEVVVNDMPFTKWIEYHDSCYFPKGGFPDVGQANEAINLISMMKKGRNHTGEIMCFGWGDAVVTDKDATYIRCENEAHLLKEFITYWQDGYVDVITGWNCIPVTQSIWLDNKIIKIGNIKEVYNRTLHDSLLEKVYPITKKKKYDIRLENGKTISSSNEHIFPIIIKEKTKYTNDLTKYPIYNKTLNDIETILNDGIYDIYFTGNLNDNTNKDLTWKDLIINNLELLLSKGLIINIRTPYLISKLSTHLGYSIGESKKISLFDIDNLLTCCTIEEIKHELRNITEIDLKPINGKKYTNINIDSPISENDMWFAGIWFTDGTHTKTSEIVITNTCESIITRCNNIENKKESNKFDRPRENMANVAPYWKCKSSIYNNKNILLKAMLYNTILYKAKKEISVELLSQLSKPQFLSFIAGCIDGDGSIHRDGKTGDSYSLCNFDNQLDNFQELLEWNGIYSTRTKSNVRFKTYLSEITHDNKKSEIISTSMCANAKSKNIRVQIQNNKTYIRLDSITDTNEYVDMIDIQTNTHYFVTQGITTHNCIGFDVPYIVNRITNVLGEDWVKKLSPYKIITGKVEKNIFGSEYTKYTLAGLTVLDYLEIYKKFNPKVQESYKLDFIASMELNDNKIEYEGSFRDFYTKDFQRFVEYNIHDTRLVFKLDKKLGYINLAATIAYKAKVSLDDITGTVRVWDVIIANALAINDIHVPTYNTKNDDTGYGGGYVKVPLVGFYEWLLSIDATSLYPSEIMYGNVSPETLVDPKYFIKLTPDDFLEKTEKYHQAIAVARSLNATLCANGAMFYKDREGIIPNLTNTYFQSRVYEKNLGKQYDGVATNIKKILKERGVSYV